MPNIQQYAQMAELPPIVELYELDASAFGHGRLYFCNSVWTDTARVNDAGEPVQRVISKGIKVGGRSYQPFPIKMGDLEIGSDDAQKTASLTISIVHYSIRGLLVNAGWFRGAVVKRSSLLKECTDDGESPNSEAQFNKQIWIVDAHSISVKEAIATFTLVPSIGYDRQITGQQILSFCQFDSYRYWDGSKWVYPAHCCPYRGTKCFDKNNAACDNAQDDCKRDLTACKLRHGRNNIPFCGTTVSKRSG